MVALPVNWPVLKPALIRRSALKSVSVRTPFTSLTTPVPVTINPSEHLVNLYAPVVLFHWSRLPVALSFRQASNDGAGGGRVKVNIVPIVKWLALLSQKA